MNCAEEGMQEEIDTIEQQAAEEQEDDEPWEVTKARLADLNNQGNTFLDQRNYVEAARLYRQCLQERRSILGEMHSLTLQSKNNLALALLYAREYNESEQLFRHCLSVWDVDIPSLLSPPSSSFLQSNHQRADDSRFCMDKLKAINNLALLYHYRAENGEQNERQSASEDIVNSNSNSYHDMALSLYQHGLKMLLLVSSSPTKNGRETTHHSDDRDSISQWLIERIKEQPYQSKAQHHNNLQRQSRDSSPSTQDIAAFTMMDNIACTYASKCKLLRNHLDHSNFHIWRSIAHSFYQLSLKGRLHYLGDKHPDTLQVMNNFGLFHHEMAEMMEIMLNEKDLSVVVNSKGSGDKEELLQKEWDSAERLYQRCLMNRQEVLGENHPDTLVTTNNLGGLYLCKKQYSLALPLIVQSFSKRRVVLGETHPETLTSMFTLALLYDQQQDDSRELAKELFEDCLTKRRTVLGENHPDTIRARAKVEGFQ